MTLAVAGALVILLLPAMAALSSERFAGQHLRPAPGVALVLILGLLVLLYLTG